MRVLYISSYLESDTSTAAPGTSRCVTNPSYQQKHMPGPTVGSLSDEFESSTSCRVSGQRQTDQVGPVSTSIEQSVDAAWRALSALLVMDRLVQVPVRNASSSQVYSDRLNSVVNNLPYTSQAPGSIDLFPRA